MQKSSKEQKEMEVLMGLVSLYLKDGRPVGSNTLKEQGFSHISSVTIRNYFALLEKKGLLKQHHISGGRVPTHAAFRMFAEKSLRHHTLLKADRLLLESVLLSDTKQFSKYFQKSIEVLSEMTGCAVLLASPRFDQDFVSKIRILSLDEKRALCVIISEFGLINTEVLYLHRKLSSFSLKRIEDYFAYRLSGENKPEMSPDEEEFAKYAYNEIILRHFISFTHFEYEDVYRTGFSKLLTHTEFHDPSILANTLGLFENIRHVRQFAKATLEEGRIAYWIGDDLAPFILPPHVAGVVGLANSIQGKPAGVILLLGPDRLDYPGVFAKLHTFAEFMGQKLSLTVEKYKLSYREFRPQTLDQHKTTAEITYKTRRDS